MPRVCRTFQLRLPAAVLMVCACLAAACNVEEPRDTTVAIPISARAEPPVLTEDDWAAWRGGEHQGISNGIRLPVEWDQRHGIIWSVPVDAGRSSPVVCGDQVILTSEQEAEGGSRCTLHCFDRHSGESRWTTPLGVATGPTHRKNGYASATPATDGRRIVTSLPPLGIFCHDMQGTLLWQQPLGELEQQWGFASSPVLYEGLAIQLADSQRDSFLTAFSIETGKVAWRVPRESQGCWSTPVIANLAGRDLLIVNGTGKTDGSQGEVVAYDPADGAVEWRETGTTDIPCPTPILADELVISTSGGNGPIMALRPAANLASEERIAWKHAAGGPYVPTGIAYDGLLFVIADGGVLTCYEAATGEKQYRKRLHGTFSASLVAGDGKLYVTSEQGDCYVIRTESEFALLSTNRMRDRCLATPAIAYGNLFLRTESMLYAIGGSGGESGSGSQPAGGKVLPSPSDSGGGDLAEEPAAGDAA